MTYYVIKVYSEHGKEWLPVQVVEDVDQAVRYKDAIDCSQGWKSHVDIEQVDS